MIDDDCEKFGVSTYRRYESFGTVIERFPGSPHSKSALLLLKNGLNVSYLNHYKWTIYLEYDIKSPILGYKNFLDNIVNNLESSGKKCFYYENTNNYVFLWGGLFVFDTERLYNNKILMNTDWFSSSRNWIKTFKLGFFESVVEFLFSESFDDSEISKIVGVIVSVVYVGEVAPLHGEHARSENLIRVTYTYDLEITQKELGFEVTGGEWHSNAHPDFLWVPKKGDVAHSSLDQYGVGFTGTEFPLDRITRGGQMASQGGYPLCPVISKLLKESSAQDYSCPVF